MAKSFTYYLLTLIFIFLMGSCTSNKIIPTSQVNNPLTEKSYLNVINNQYPDSFAITQRILLNVAGKQYDFIGQLTMNRGAAYRAVAFGEMGGQFIDLLAAGDSVDILANPTSLPEKPILQGVAEDIEQLFYYYNIRNLIYSDSDSTIVKVAINRQKDGQLVYLINRNNNKILNLNYFFENKLIRSAKFLEYEKQDGWDREIPSYIKMTNHRWHYSLEINLLKFGTKFNADKVFNVN
jgi:hypothetical protein